MITLLQTGYYTQESAGISYSAATTGMFVLIIWT